MKKFSYFLLGAAALTLASCSSEDVAAPGAADGNFTVKVQLPADLATRAITPSATEYGQGKVANELRYFVYECNATGAVVNNHFVIEGTQYFDEGSLETEVSLTLANGKYYQMAFFAANTNALDGVYTIDPGNAVINVDYGKMVSDWNNVDAYDCFYRLYPTGEIGAAMTNTNPTVYLYRPVAQINWGTNDLDETAVTDANAFGTPSRGNIQTVFTADLFTAFNMLTSTVDGNSLKQDVSFNAMSIPNVYKFPVEGYEYLAMQYVLAPANPEDNTEDYGYLSEVGINVTTAANPNGHHINVSVDNCPLQANWRTNIYGSLLTDNFNVNVVKEPSFWGEFNVEKPWGGNATMPDMDAQGNATISRASDLAGLAHLLAEGNDFEGKTVTLTQDLDLGGLEGEIFPGIGSGTRSSNSVSGNSFKGVFDGGNHTISNLNVVYNGTDKNSTVGFIANLDGESAALQNVTFENVTINGGVAEQAGVVGTLTNGAKVSGVTVTSGTVTSGESAGAIVGRMMMNGTIENCNNGASVNGTANVGGIVGSAYYNTADSYEMEITGCTNTGDVTSTGNVAGGIAGLSVANVSGCTNKGTVKGLNGTGGIIGIAASYGTISGNTNNGFVSGSTYVGGIVGWLTYYTSPSYGHIEVITITKNTNNGNVKASAGSAGGVLGMSQNKGTVTDNTNTANSITGSTAAGIVGDCSVSTGDNIWSGGLTITGNTSSTEGLAIYNGTAAEGSQDK